MRALILFLVSAALFGCAADRSKNPAWDDCTRDDQCAADEVCVEGFCVASGMDAGRRDAGDGGEGDAGMPCPTERQCYSGSADERGVGACTVGCLVEVDGGSICAGEGAPSTEACNEIDDDCDGTVDEGFDKTLPTQCGGCGLACEGGSACCDRAGDGSGYACTNTSSDRDFCGTGPGCGIRCQVGEVCCAGACVALGTNDNCSACGDVCTGDTECCDGSCVDTRSSVANCGRCGDGCDAPDGGAVACCNGVCSDPEATACRDCDPTCDGDTPDCCSGLCVDRALDPQNCGECGTVCPAGDRCCGGICTPVSDTDCGGCANDCGDGARCCVEDRMCRDITGSDCTACGAACAGGTVCCLVDGGGECANTTSSPIHCGTCGRSCDPGEICSNSNCCPAGQRFCNGSCSVPTNGSCEACNVPCPVLHGCVNGTCVFLSG